MNAIDLLKDQHNVVLGAIDGMLDGDVIHDDELLAVADKLVAHMVIEEHIFYPRVGQLNPALVSESFEEHTVARFELGRAILAEGAEKKARLTVLKEILDHHIDEEEDEVFRQVQAGIDARELDQLGVRMQSAFDKAVQKGFSRLVVEGYTLRGGAHGVRTRETTRVTPTTTGKRKTPQQHGRTPKTTLRRMEARRS